MADANNLAGHRARYAHLSKTLPPEKVGFAYAGGLGEIDPGLVGILEGEAILRHHTLANAHVIDLGCGVGRLTRHLVTSPVHSYLGTDILPEILAEAQKVGAERPTFRFALTDDCSIPERDGEADIVCGFSLITHLLDEEAFIYFREASRVLRSGGLAVFSFLDYSHPRHRSLFTRYADSYKVQRDLLKFFDKNTLLSYACMAKLDVIEIVDGLQELPPSGVRATGFGQSLIYIRKL